MKLFFTKHKRKLYVLLTFLFFLDLGGAFMENWLLNVYYRFFIGEEYVQCPKDYAIWAGELNGYLRCEDLNLYYYQNSQDKLKVYDKVYGYSRGGPNE